MMRREVKGLASSKMLRVEPALSPQRAFVVQFRVGTDTEPETFTGRVEHMISGRSAHFSAAKELLAFLRRVLSEKQ